MDRWVESLLGVAQTALLGLREYLRTIKDKKIGVFFVKINSRHRFVPTNCLQSTDWRLYFPTNCLRSTDWCRFFLTKCLQSIDWCRFFRTKWLRSTDWRLFFRTKCLQSTDWCHYFPMKCLRSTDWCRFFQRSTFNQSQQPYFLILTTILPDFSHWALKPILHLHPNISYT